MMRCVSIDIFQIIMGVIGGVVIGYIFWLVVIFVGDGLMMVS